MLQPMYDDATVLVTFKDFLAIPNMLRFNYGVLDFSKCWMRACMYGSIFFLLLAGAIYMHVIGRSCTKLPKIKCPMNLIL